MSKFFLWLKQSGGGCDYTIGCAEKLIPLHGVTSLVQAHAVVRSKLHDFGETEFESAHILSFEEDAMSLVHAHADQRKARQEEYEKQQKREQLERLKRELGE